MATRACTKGARSVGSTNRVCMSSSREEVSRALAAWLRGPRAPIPEPARSTQPPLALFLCRENAAASIMAEALLRHLAKARVRAASAGDCPAARVNPHALECLRAHGIATTGLRTKGGVRTLARIGRRSAFSSH